MKNLGERSSLEEVERRVTALEETDTAQWGVMSAGEMVRHVEQAFRVAVGEATVEQAPSPLPRGLFKWLALRVPRQWPHNVPTIPELRRGTERMQVGAFRDGQAALLEVLRRFAAGERLGERHPIFGRMRPGDWMRWGYLHADHHLRQFGR